MFQNKNLIFMMLWIIKNGNSDENFRKYPYVVGIGFIEKEQETQKEIVTNACSGSLIEESWVITAGSCIHKYSNREHFVSFDEYNDGKLSVRKVEVLNRQLFSYDQSEGEEDMGVTAPTIFGMLKIRSLPIKTLPKLSSDNYIHRFGLSVVYAKYLACPENVKTNRLEIIELVIFACPTVFQAFICINDQVNAITTHYGAPLIYDDTVIGLFAGSVDNYKMFVPVSEYLDKIREKMAEENKSLFKIKLEIGLYSNHSKLGGAHIMLPRTMDVPADR